MIATDPSHLAFMAILAAFLGAIVFRQYIFVRRRGSVTTPKDGPRASQDRTYRVRGVPTEWDEVKLQTVLKAHDASCDAVIGSLSIEYHNRYKTATVMFRDGARPPKKLEGGMDPCGGGYTLQFDEAFMELTTLFKPPPDDHRIDIVAINGLGGHAFGSFKERDGPHMWLRDALPQHLRWEHTDLSMARVAIYGYESAIVNSSSMKNLEDLGGAFRESLKLLMVSGTTKPLILVAHSLGGLILKQALISLASSDVPENKAVLDSVYGIVFFGVPHDGMDTSSLMTMVGNGPNRDLVASIDRINSQILTIQQREFHRALGAEGHTEVFCFYETLKSPTAQRDDTGHWRMNGPEAVLVTKSSATHCRPWEDGSEHICAIDRSHMNMVKFGKEDDDYERTLLRLRGLAKRALDVGSRSRMRNTKFIVPYRRNPHYVDRSDILDKIKDMFGYGRSRTDTTHFKVSLYGLGGVGKSQIALAFAYWIGDNYPDVSVFWVSGSSAERFAIDSATIAEKCSIPGHNDPKANKPMLVRRWLEENERGRWLMVVDNADDSRLFAEDEDGGVEGCLSEYIPQSGRGSILFTSRNKETASLLAEESELIPVPCMTSDEAERLLRARTTGSGGNLSSEHAEALALRLDHLPLALVQAAAFMEKKSMSVDKYIRRLDESDLALVLRLSEPFKTVGRESNAPRAVTATWIVSFEHIKQQQPLASDLLSLMSLMDRESIPEQFMSDYCRRMRPDDPCEEVAMDVDKALGSLKAYCFVSPRGDDHVDMHRLIQLVTRKWLVDKKTMDIWVERSVSVLSSAYPHGEYETRETCREYLAHAETVMSHTGADSRDEQVARAQLSHRVASYLSYLNQWAAAERRAAQAVELRGHLFGQEDPYLLASQSDLASIYCFQGRWKEAEELGGRVMQTMIDTLGEAHPDSLASMNNLALVYMQQGRWKEAEQLNSRVVQTMENLHGQEHVSTLTSMSNLASTYRRQGRWSEAEKLQSKQLTLCLKSLGQEHPHTLTSMGNLALIYWEQGRLGEAEDLLSKQLALTLHVYGEGHPTTLLSQANLASIYRTQGRWGEAEKLEADVLETRRLVLGIEHPDTLTSMANLAATHENQGRLKEAEAMELSVMKTKMRVLGTEHPSTLTSMNNLAMTYSEQGRWIEAEELQDLVMERRRRTLGEEHPHTLSSIANLASTYVDQGRLQEAERLQVQVMNVTKRRLGEEHPDTLNVMGKLGANYRKQGRLREAIELELRVMDTRKRLLGEEHPNALSSYYNVATTYRKQGRLQEAETLGMHATETRQRTLGEDHPHTLQSMAELASTYSEQLRWQDAQTLQLRVVEARKRVLGEQHPDTIASSKSLEYMMACQQEQLPSPS